MDLHSNLAPVESLIGVWRGEGTGHYPTIPSFTFDEELTFTNIGKPFLHYQQRTWGPGGTPIHTETGYVRVVGSDLVEFVLALPTGQAEIGEGPLIPTDTGFSMSLTSQVINSSTAKLVELTVRKYVVDGDRLHTSFGMAAVGQNLTNHLETNLVRVGENP
ncbi:FABP family protein [Flaviflexus massiliensis]|uniref:FABP family protein n=1 Tax=Flaviflexus massiliensis TaxID=1522309 RepID=UPI0006D56CD8|nr:FABP family protein [Flaviflexus massiliensis]